MSNDESALREVDQELSEDRQWALFRKYGPVIIAGAVAVVLGVAGWQFWNGAKDSAAKEQSLALRNALELMEEDPDAGRQDLAALAADTSSGVGVLANFHRAASFVRNGERLAAVAAFREIYRDNATPKRLRTLARLRAAHLSLADGRDEVLKDIGDLDVQGDALSHYAREVLGLAAMREKDFPTATAIFDEIQNAPDAPAPVSLRAKEFAAHARSGQNGVNIFGELLVDDILGAVSEGVDGENHEGHDHEDGEPIIEEGTLAPNEPNGSEIDDSAPRDPNSQPSEEPATNE